MRTTESIAQIATALAAAQGEMHNPVKDRVARVKSDKADYTYNYADLSSVLDAVRPPLAKHGIALLQTAEVTPPAMVEGANGSYRVSQLVLTTRLVHSSGEWIETQLSSEVDPDAKIQTLGSAITYLRRYALQAIVGVVAEEDDDGNAAQGTKAATAPRAASNGSNPPTRRPAGDQQPANGAAPAAGAASAAAPRPLTAKQRYENACEAINERLGSAAGHKMIMSVRSKYGGENMTEAQRVLLLKELERLVASGVAPATAGA